MKKSPLLSIFLIVFVDVLGFTIILPLLPFYAEHLGATPVVVGILIATYGFCQLIAGPILGQISDRAGRKPVLLVSQFGTFIGFIILALSRTLPLVFISRIIDGLTAGNLSVAQAYIADVTEPKNRAKSFGLIGIAFGMGFLLGPAITGVLAHFGHQYPIYAAAGLSLASIAGTFFLLPHPSTASIPRTEEPEEHIPHRHKGLSFKIYLHAFQNKNLAPLLWQFFAFIFAFATFISGFALFAERRFLFHGTPFGAKEVGYIFAYVGLIAVIIQARLIGKLVGFFGEKRLIRTGFICMLAGSLLLGGSYGIPFLLFSVTVSFIGSSILRPSLTSLITQKVGKNQQGMVLGLTQSLMSISQIIAPVISGVLIQHHLLNVWAWMAAFVTGIGLWLTRYE